MSQRLTIAREQFAAAKKEFDIALSAEGFSPVRADKANSWLEAARAELNNALAQEQGERYRERALSNLERRYHQVERNLRYCELKLRQAMMIVNLTYYDEIGVETVERRVSDACAMIDHQLSFKGLSQTKRRNLETTKACLAEVSYRLTFVKDARYEVAKLQADIAALKPHKGIAAA